jgi:signal peptidase I
MNEMRFFSTWRQVTFSPAKFFSRPPDERPRGSSWPFALVVGAIASSGYMFWDRFFLHHRTIGFSAISGSVGLLTSPLNTLWTNSLAALGVWLGLRLLRRRAPFREALDTVNHATAPLALMVVPLAGTVAGVILYLRALLAGLRQRHSLSFGAAFGLMGGYLAVGVAIAMAMPDYGRSEQMPSNSMVPTITADEYFFADDLAYRFSRPRRGDVVVFASPKDPKSEYVKRVIGIAGDRITISGYEVSVNGKPLRTEMVGDGRPYEYEDTPAYLEYSEKVAGSIHAEEIEGLRYEVLHTKPRIPDQRLDLEVPEGSVFVLGDNRDNSLDSRHFGPVPSALVRGRASLVWLSFDHGHVRWDRIWTHLSERRPLHTL